MPSARRPSPCGTRRTRHRSRRRRCRGRRPAPSVAGDVDDAPGHHWRVSGLAGASRRARERRAASSRTVAGCRRRRDRPPRRDPRRHLLSRAVDPRTARRAGRNRTAGQQVRPRLVPGSRQSHWPTASRAKSSPVRSRLDQLSLTEQPSEASTRASTSTRVDVGGERDGIRVVGRGAGGARPRGVVEIAAHPVRCGTRCRHQRALLWAARAMRSVTGRVSPPRRVGDERRCPVAGSGHARGWISGAAGDLLRRRRRLPSLARGQPRHAPRSCGWA